MDQHANLLVVGPNTLLNQLIAFAVRSELGETCTVCSGIDEATTGCRANTPTTMMLADDSDAHCRSGLFRLLGSVDHCTGPRVIAALFNVDEELSNLAEAVRHGVKGLFFSSDHIEQVIEGVRLLLSGEVWIPKEVLIRAATARDEETGRVVEQSRLTMREIEVLALVSTGATNDQIAEELYISPHTVKTHMYNIFQKIGADNRLHAAIWAARYLKGRLPIVSPADALGA